MIVVKTKEIINTINTVLKFTSFIFIE